MMNIIAGDVVAGRRVSNTIRIATVIVAVAVHLATIVKSPG